MRNLFIYPGSFDPPTYGHFHIVKKFVEIYNLPLTIVCSENPDKQDGWFTTDEVKAMWKTYDLPKGVEVLSLSELQANYSHKEYRFIMVRGIRDNKDAEYEKEIMIYNNREYHIDNFIYIYCDKSFLNVSSTKVRNKAKNYDFHDLHLDVSIGVIRYLWKSVLSIEDIILVVGRPGSGKTTLLKKLVKQDDGIRYINTDDYNQALKPKLKQYFQTDDLFEIAKTREQELISVISKSWLDLLFQDLAKTNDLFADTEVVVVEIAYGLQPRKDMYRFVGDHVLNIWCSDNLSRNTNRNTERLKFFIDKIPDLNETIAICEQNSLKLINVCTDKEVDLAPIIREMIVN